MDLERQKKIAIGKAKHKIALIYKARKDSKLTDADRATITEQQTIIDRWGRMTRRGVRL